MHGISYRGNIPSLFYLHPFHLHQKLNIRLHWQIPISQIISNETQLLRRWGNCKLSVKGPKLHEAKITLYTVIVKKQRSEKIGHHVL